MPGWSKLVKCGKAAGTSLIVYEMVNACRVEGIQKIRDQIEDIMHFGKIPTEWEDSIIVSIDKGKGVALGRENYRGFKVLDQGHEGSRERDWELFYNNKCA